MKLLNQQFSAANNWSSTHLALPRRKSNQRPVMHLEGNNKNFFKTFGLIFYSLASGNLAKFLPFLLKEISKEERKQYLFLHALKEVINGQCNRQNGEPSFDQADPTFSNGIDNIWTLLIKYCNSNEESIRNVVAECVGRLCIVNPRRCIAELLVIWN